MSVFYTKRPLRIYINFIIIAFVISFGSFFIPSTKDYQIVVIISVIVFIFDLWRLKTTYTILNNKILRIKFLFIKREILVHEIETIEYSKFSIFSVKFGKANYGLKIKTKDKKLFITPVNELEFVQELLKIKPEINLIKLN
jgi:hypothetical protein